MAEKIVKYFDMVVASKDGIKNSMRLAMKTGFSSKKAAEVPDSKENLDKVYAAIKEILGADTPQL